MAMPMAMAMQMTVQAVQVAQAVQAAQVAEEVQAAQVAEEVQAVQLVTVLVAPTVQAQVAKVAKVVVG